jgi:hypothetical protein
MRFMWVYGERKSKQSKSTVGRMAHEWVVQCFVGPGR